MRNNKIELLRTLHAADDGERRTLSPEIQLGCFSWSRPFSIFNFR